MTYWHYFPNSQQCCGHFIPPFLFCSPFHLIYPHFLVFCFLLIFCHLFYHHFQGFRNLRNLIRLHSHLIFGPFLSLFQLLRCSWCHALLLLSTVYSFFIFNGGSPIILFCLFASLRIASLSHSFVFC